MRKTDEVPEVGIVLCTYNGEKYIREQLESLFQSTWKNLQIDVYDDGSVDETIAIVEEYVADGRRIQVHKNEKNRGYTMNFLEAIRQCKSPYIMLCDQDDIWHEDKIEKTVARMQELEKKRGRDIPLMVFTDAMNVDDETGVEQGSFHENSHLNTKKIDTAHLFMENKCIGCTIMINAQVVAYLNTLPEEIRVHDWWLALICSHFGEISYLAETTLQYRQHSGNMIGGSGFLDYVKKRMAALREQREVIRKTFAQGNAFYDLFGEQLTGEVKEIAQCFARMEDAGWLKRRWNMFYYGFFKSGFVRNVALFFLI